MHRQGTHAKRSLIDFARNLRQVETSAEEVLWRFLRNRRLCGLKFRRQHQISKFILDFYNAELKLAIELDGEPHFEKAAHRQDLTRADALKMLGITVIRFSNDQVFSQLKFVIHEISMVAWDLRSRANAEKRGHPSPGR